MDQDAVEREQQESGERLIETLAASGFDVTVAFWAMPTEEGTWLLFLASPAVDKEGPTAA